MHLPIVKRASADHLKVALTFDDGPNPYATPQILDIFGEEGVRGTFFLIGRWADQNPSLVERMLAEGHTIGGHTYWHGGDDDRLPWDGFQEGNLVLQEITGQPVRYLRVPQFGYWTMDRGIPRINQLTSGVLSDPIRAGALTVVDHSLNTEDWDPQVPPELILDRICYATAGSIVVLHDGSHRTHEREWRPQRTVQVLREAVRRLKSEGFELVSMDELSCDTEHVEIKDFFAPNDLLVG